MPNLTTTAEALILAALSAKILAVAGVANVVIDEPLLDSKFDVLKTICVRAVDGKTEVKYLKIDFLGFVDSATDGCDDEPLVFIRYKLHAFQQYRDKRADGTTSTNDIKRLVINLRNEFLRTDNKARRILEKCETQPLKQENFIILGNDPLTGAYGHFTDLICTVELT